MASVPMPEMSGKRPARVRKTCASLAVASIGAFWLPGASAQSIPIPTLNQPPIQSGLAFAWGNNQTGELGQGNKKDPPYPCVSPVSPGPSRLSRRARTAASR